MIIQIDNLDKNTKIDVIVCYDKCGNIYFKCDDAYYFLVIGDNDTLQIEQSHNMEKLLGHTYNIKLEKLKNSNDEKSLKGKILNKLEEERERENDDENNENSESEDEGETKLEQNDRFFPEQKYYYHDIPDEEEIEYDEFKFYSSGDTSILQYLDIDLDALSNYNTIIMNPHTKIVEMTLESNESIAYELIIFTTGQIDLNVIGSKRKTFKLEYKINPEKQNDENADDGIFVANCIGITSLINK